MVLDYKNFKLVTEKSRNLNSTTPCETCVSAACSHSKAMFFEWMECKNDNNQMFFRVDKKCENIHFKNFPNLHIKNNAVKDCIFENCQSVAFYESNISDTTFKNVSSIAGKQTNFKNCDFTGCCSQGSLLTINKSGSIEKCNFDNNVALSEDGYMIHMVFDSEEDITKIKDCGFAYNTVENPDGEMVHSEYLKVVTTTKSTVINNIDYETCDFREGEAIEIGSFDLDVPEGDYGGIEIIGSFVSEDD